MPVARLALSPLAAALVLALSAPLLGQDSDTVIYRDAPRGLTVLDQSEDPAERAALQRLFDTGEPGRRVQLAKEFLQEYPRSWALAFVYEMAAKASIEVEELDAAVSFAGRSLQILPENPLLLVSMANVHVHRGESARAERAASEALRHLDAFDRPAQFSTNQWARLEPQLRASCHYVLGRILAERGLESDGAGRADTLERAADSLRIACELNPDDLTARYLLGTVALALGRHDEAHRQLATVAHGGGPLADRAREQLTRIPPHAAAGDRTVSAPTLANAMSNKLRRSHGPARYAGSRTCQECHPAEYRSWSKTGMARMFRPAQPQHVLGNFDNQVYRSPSSGEKLARMKTGPDGPLFAIRAVDGAWSTFTVDYVIGSKWQQAYATELPSGDIHVLPLQYSEIEQRWLNFWAVIDPPGSRRTKLQRFPELGPETSYLRNCAMCHTSQLRGGAGREPGAFRFHEPGVNCEMCHGPSADHAKVMRSGSPLDTTHSQVPVRFNELGSAQYVEICGRCHMQSNVVELGPRGEINFTGHADKFYAAYLGRPLAEFSRKAFHADGRFRETTFIGESFVRSACYQRGQANCGHCHDPHPADPASNPKSLKFLDDPDKMCLQCHSAFSADVQRHTHHPPESAASRCTACHMPKVMHSLLFQASTHRIDDIPAAEMTMRFGQEKSPNACLICHSNRDGAWALANTDDW